MQYKISKQVVRAYKGNSFYNLNPETAFYFRARTSYFYQMEDNITIDYNCTEVFDLTDEDVRDIISKLTALGFQYIAGEYKARTPMRKGEPIVEITIRIDKL